MTVINTNVGALQARTYAVRADNAVTKAMERLSSGLRINSAADDAAGLAVANKMESQIRGMNMAIRNSQDGISLVQTAEAAMGEINNMVIRMRELAVQMNNGVYTDADRSNAQLEVTALLAEIDKVADNSAFNQVKILDGTYSQDIRAGNTNPEVINVTIDRMNTDALGGGRVTTGDVAATTTTNTFQTSNTVLEAEEGRVNFGITKLGQAIQDHANLYQNGSWSLASSGGTSDNLKFEIDSASGSVTLNSQTPLAELAFDENVAANNTYTFAVEYTQNNVTVRDNIELRITNKAPVTSNATGFAELEVEEGDCIKIYSVDHVADQKDGIFSNQFKEFVGANAGNVTFALGAHQNGRNDSGQFTLNTATGEILANLDFERPTDTGGDANVYDFSVTATVGTGASAVVVTEHVTLTVTDDHAAQVTLAGGATPVNHTDVAAAAGADGAALESTSNTIAAADTTAISGTLTADLSGAGGNDVALTWAQIDGMILAGGGSDGTAAWIAAQNGDAYTVTVSNGGSSTIAASTATGTPAVIPGITFDNDGVSQDDVVITLANAANGEKFIIEFDFVVTNAGTGNHETATDFVTANDDELVRSGASSSLDARAGGEALTIDLKVASAGQNATTNDTFFNTIGDAYDADPCGTFEIVADTIAFDGVLTTAGTDSVLGTSDDNNVGAQNLSVSADGILTLKAGAAEGSYSALVKYTNNDGDSTYERVVLNTVDIGEASGVDEAHAVTLTTTTPTRLSSEQIAGTSVLELDEARQGNITSTGDGRVLSSAFNSFVTSYTGGTYSLSGADSTLFNINSETGVFETKGLVDFEKKTSYNLTVTYTAGNNTYKEDVTINVDNNEDDDGSHIIDVNLGTQAGAATAVTILDTAINQITESQAKLGAIQNRLQYNIDNLSKASMLTTTAKGRIMDADFASETSELSKQQILSQAATSMLAQANQSKQSVLALLQ